MHTRRGTCAMFVSLPQWLCCLFRQVLYSSWFCKCDWSLWLSPFISCAHHSLQVRCFCVVSSCNIISCAHHSLQVCCKCLPCSPNRLLRFTGYEPRALGLSVDCSSVEGPVDVSRTRLDRLGPTYSSCVDSTLSHHHLLTILPAQDQFTVPHRFTRSVPIFAGSLVVVPSLS